MATTLSTVQSALGGSYDQLIDPVTLDYVRTPTGEWAETADSRTAMLIQLETELNGSVFTPSDGTRIKALLRAGDPVTAETILAETLRAGELLVRAGVIADLTGEIRDAAGELLRDEADRPIVVLHWRDLNAGSPVDLAYRVGA